MTKLLDKEVEEFNKIFLTKDKVIEQRTLGWCFTDYFYEQFRQSLTRYARAVIEEAIPEEKLLETGRGVDYFGTPSQPTFTGAEKMAFNTCRTKFKENLEKLLGSKEDK
jgi:hypothetical protein